MALPKDNLSIDLSLGARLPLPLDLSIIPVATFLGLIWVVVKHDNHSWLQLVPLVHSTSTWPNVLCKQLNHTILCIAVKVKTINDFCNSKTSSVAKHGQNIKNTCLNSKDQ